MRIVRHAAALSSRLLTDFVVQAAVNEAERVLAGRARYALDAEAWDRFTELLDRPVRDNPRLAKRAREAERVRVAGALSARSRPHRAVFKQDSRLTEGLWLSFS
jgi:uncharacterized protein (DUF1778 family)